MTSFPPNRSSDFLGQLIERSSDAGGALRPRVPSLFEPVAWTAQRNDFSGDDDTVSAPEEETHLQMTSTGESSIAPRTTENLGGRNADAARAVTGERATVRPGRTVSSPNDRLSAVQSVTTTTETILKVVTDRIAHEPPRAMPLPRSARIETTSGSPRDRATRTESAPLEPKQEAQRIEETRPETAFATIPLRHPPHQGVMAERSGVFDASRVPREQFFPGASDSTPVINVTIGRLEIRAVKDAAASAKPTPAVGSQPMSLDEYLKQRGSGR